VYTPLQYQVQGTFDMLVTLNTIPYRLRASDAGMTFDMISLLPQGDLHLVQSAFNLLLGRSSVV
jgi:hypothetical protein